MAGQTTHLVLQSATGPGPAPTSVSLFDQGLVQVLQASVTGLKPKPPYILALATKPDGSGTIEPRASFMTNLAGSAIIDTAGPIRQIVEGADMAPRRYLIIAEGKSAQVGTVVQVQHAE